MTTKTEALIAPTVTADVAGVAQRFNVAAITNNFGADALFGRYQELKFAGARHDPDVFSGVGFSTVLDAVLDYRARGDRTFDVLAIAQAKK